MPERMIQYALSDGQLRGIWEGHTELLLAQVPPEDPVFGYLHVLLEDPGASIPPEELLQQWYVENDLLTAKTELTLSATPSPFPADGTTECVVTVEPFVACTVLVNDETVPLTPIDPSLELTSDVPQRFEIRLEPMPTHWAQAIIAEAT